MSDLARALQALRPGTDFADTDGTLAGIRWDTPGVVPPTQGEVDAEKTKPARVTVSRLRFKLELARRDLLAKVDAAVTAAGDLAPLYWAEAAQFESDHPLVLKIGAAIGLDEAAIRELFTAAATRDA